MTLPTQPHFQPFHTAHAIVEMVAFYEFARQIASATDQFTVTSEHIATLFGAEFAFQSLEVQEVEATQAGLAFRTMPAFELRKGADPNRPDWLIRIEPYSFSIHALNYTRWPLVLAEVQRLGDMLLAHAVNQPLDLAGVGLRYLDQFNFIGDLAAYDARLLFKGSPYINPKAFDSGPRWHCHTGWFEDREPEVLNQVNLNSILPPPEATAPPLVTIEHAQAIRNKPITLLDQYFRAKDAAGARSALLNRLHEANKLVMDDLLCSDVSKLINLTVKKADA
jgi:uncharacterized protein (TIGR04255 family)